MYIKNIKNTLIANSKHSLVSSYINIVLQGHDFAHLPKF